MQPSFWAIVLICPALGCTPAQEPDADPAPEAPQVLIRHPIDGASVADTVTIRLAIENPSALHRLVLVVDGRTDQERFRPPWGFVWETAALADSSWHILQIAAGDEAGRSRLSDSCRVRVCANAPPEIEILWPPAGRWIDLDRPSPSWRCRVDDPDEGPLPDGQIEWRLDGEQVAGSGREISPPPLSMGAHLVTARARDRWARWSEAKVMIHGFRYPGSHDPQAALETFLCALRAGDAETAVAQLAPDFSSCEPLAQSSASATDRHEESQALQVLLDPLHFLSLQIDALPSPPETLSWRGAALAQIELGALALHACWRCAPDTGQAGGGGPDAPAARDLQVMGSGGRIGLRCLPDSAGGNLWRLWVWRDLHGACWRPRGGLSWSAVKQLCREQRICP
ncbi:MAG: hypothetical protein KAY32_01820 [Candidatus Eisenbacteria sp.]|nr:hypothetical protein [Candidatus Eisenbacteria bacterium]